MYNQIWHVIIWKETIHINFMETQKISVPIDWRPPLKKYNVSQWDPKLFGHQHSSKYIFCSAQYLGELSL